jgi:hypothetical protein
MRVDDIQTLRTALRDLVALSAIPAVWVGRDPQMIATNLADALIGSLRLGYAFVRLRDPFGGSAVEVAEARAGSRFRTGSPPPASI